MNKQRKAVYTESHKGSAREPEIVFTAASGEDVEFRPSPALEEVATHRNTAKSRSTKEGHAKEHQPRSVAQTASRSVRNVMTPRVVAVTSVTFLPEAAQIMLQEDVGALPVVQADGTLLGIITDRDITVRAVAEGKDITQTQVSEVFTAEDLVTVSPDTAIAEAQQIMAEHQVRRLPIVEHDNKLVGMVSLADLAQAGKQQIGSVLKDVSQPGGAHSQSEAQ